MRPNISNINSNSAFAALISNSNANKTSPATWLLSRLARGSLTTRQHNRQLIHTITTSFVSPSTLTNTTRDEPRLLPTRAVTATSLAYISPQAFDSHLYTPLRWLSNYNNKRRQQRHPQQQPQQHPPLNEERKKWLENLLEMASKAFVNLDYEKAIEHCNKVIAESPNAPIPYELRGESLLMQRKYTLAINDFKKVSFVTGFAFLNT